MIHRKVLEVKAVKDKKKVKNKISLKVDKYSLIRTFSAIGIASIIACIIIVCVSDNPSESIQCFFTGQFATMRKFSNVLEMMIPLVFTGLALNICFKSGLFNMGADGSFYMGAVIAALIAIKVVLPSGIHQSVIIIVAALVGGIISMIPALIKRYTGASELVTSLMFNYVFFNLGMLILNTFMLDDTTGYASYRFLKSAKLPGILKGTQLHAGIFIMIAVIIIMYFVVEKSNFGYKLRVTGSNIKFARYAGLKITGVMILSQFIGGALAGMGGAIEMIGMNSRFTWVLPVNYVWDGILINLLAGAKPILIPVAAAFISFIRIGADIMSRNTGVDSEIVAIVQGIIIVLVASERFLYFMKKRKEEKEALEDDKILESAAE